MLDGGVVMQSLPVGPQQAAAVQQAVQQPQSFQFIFWLVLALALSMVFVVESVRALPWSEKFKASKPLSCSACCVGWLSIAVGGWLGYSNGALWSVLHVLPAAALALFGLAVVHKLQRVSVGLAPPGAAQRG